MEFPSNVDCSNTNLHVPTSMIIYLHIYKLSCNNVYYIWTQAEIQNYMHTCICSFILRFSIYFKCLLSYLHLTMFLSKSNRYMYLCFLTPQIYKLQYFFSIVTVRGSLSKILIDILINYALNFVSLNTNTKSTTLKGSRFQVSNYHFVFLSLSNLQKNKHFLLI